MSGFDSFSSDSVLRRIAHSRHGSQVTVEPSSLRGIPVNLIRIRTESTLWDLWVDRDSHLVRRSVYTATYVREGRVTKEFEERLEHYDYNGVVPMSTFEPPPASEDARRDGTQVRIRERK